MAYTVNQLSLGGIGNFSCYLIKTDKGFLLIDTGVSRLRGALEKQLEMAGCIPGNLNLILLTNGTMDATGNAVYIRQKYASKIAMHRNDLNMVEHGEYPEREFRSLLPEMIYKLFIKRIGKRMTAALERFTPDVYVDEGSNLSEYGFPAKILHLPGFTPGSIGVLSQAGELFSGNTIINQGRSFEIPFVLTTFRTLEQSIAKLEAERVETIYPGMGAPFSMQAFSKRKKSA
jgi:hydroxyacylglutathione hydrolase